MTHDPFTLATIRYFGDHIKPETLARLVVELEESDSESTRAFAAPINEALVANVGEEEAECWKRQRRILDESGPAQEYNMDAFNTSCPDGGEE